VKFKHGLTVMRCQPFHIGHKRVIEIMLAECEKVTIVLGSIQEDSTHTNPFDFFERKEMLTNFFEDKIEVKGVPDLGQPSGWSKFVLTAIEGKFDAYYAGSNYDASSWAGSDLEVRVIPRNNQSFPYTSGTMIRNMCMNQDSRWMLHVPEVNWEIVKKLYTKYEFNQMGALAKPRSGGVSQK